MYLSDFFSLRHFGFSFYPVKCVSKLRVIVDYAAYELFNQKYNYCFKQKVVKTSS